MQPKRKMIQAENRHGEKIQVYADRIEQELLDIYSGFLPPEDSSRPEALDKYITASTQNRWHSVLMQIQKTVIKNRNDFLDKPYRQIDGTPIKTNHNAYDTDYISRLLDIYIIPCQRYDKEITVCGFCYLLGLSQQTIYNWLNNYDYSGFGGDDVRRKRMEIAKRLITANEDSLSAILVTGKRPVIGILGILNKRHGWNMPGVSRETARRPALSAEDLPVLNSVNSIDPPALPMPDDAESL